MLTIMRLFIFSSRCLLSLGFLISFQSVHANDTAFGGSAAAPYPIHTDEIFATKVAGYPSVFAHGMLTMGMTGKMITNLVGDGNLKNFGVRFTNQVWPGDTLTTKAEVKSIETISDKTQITFEVITENQNNIPVVTGSATALI